MRNYRKLHFAILMASALFILGPLTSCKKYEDGPYISLRSKTERVANTWKAERVTDNGEDKTSDYSDFRITLTKGGDYTITPGGTFSISSSGTWSFINDKDDIQTISKPVLGMSTTNTYKILKLKENEMWLVDGSKEYHLIPA